MNGVLFKSIGYSSHRMVYLLGRFTFNNIPIKIIMIEYDKNNNNEKTDEEDENDLTIIENDEVDDKDEIKNKKCNYDKDQLIKTNVRTYIKTGYNYTTLSDTTENYIISNLENQPNQRGIEYKDMNIMIKTAIDNKMLKEELNNIFFTMIITDKK